MTGTAAQFLSLRWMRSRSMRVSGHLLIAGGLFSAIAALLCPSSGDLSSTTADASLIAKPARVDLGTLRPGQKVSTSFRLFNVSAVPAVVHQVHSNCHCSVAKLPRERRLDPGQELEIDLTVTAGNRDGHFVTSVFAQYGGLPNDSSAGDRIYGVQIDIEYAVTAEST